MSRSTDRPRTARNTFSRRLIGGFTVTVALTILMGAASIASVITATRGADAVVASGTRQLSDSLQLSISVEQRIEDYRAYLLNAQSAYLMAFTADRQQFLAKVADLRAEVQDARALRLLGEVSSAEAAYDAALEPVVRSRAAITDLHGMTTLNSTSVAPAREALQQAIVALVIRFQGA